MIGEPSAYLPGLNFRGARDWLRELGSGVQISSGAVRGCVLNLRKRVRGFHSPRDAVEAMVQMSPNEVRGHETVMDGGARAAALSIDGVRVLQLPSVTMPNGFMMEMFRTDWPAIGSSVRQINWFQLSSGAVTGWHCHAGHTDHLAGVAGTIKLALWDGRDASPSKGATEIIRIGPDHPTMVIVPPGVWHGLRNEGGEPAAYVQVLDALYDHENPDSRRLPLGNPAIPNIL
jgi:dTDP-4-dehydrorhamnose 3,5-epimerase